MADLKRLGCATHATVLRLPPKTVYVKGARLRDGRAQHAYRHTDTGTWYQVTETAIGAKSWIVCEFVGADCPCLQGG